MFRLPSGQGAFSTEAEKRRTSTELREAISDHLNRIRAAYGPCTDSVEIVSDADEVGGKLKFLSNRSILCEVEGAARLGYRLRIRADIYYEIFTITYLIDEIGKETNGDVSLQMARLPRDPGATKWLFDDLWNCDAFPPNQLVRQWALQSDDPACSRAVGELVADFRTILLYPRENWELDKPSLEFARIAISQESQIAPEILAFASEHQQLIREVSGSNHSGGEPILCGMAGGQALYVSELGQWGADAREINPIRLMLVYAGHSDAQLGRLMRRLHVLGELRHAAVLDWDRTSFGHHKDLRTASSQDSGAQQSGQ